MRILLFLTSFSLALMTGLSCDLISGGTEEQLDPSILAAIAAWQAANGNQTTTGRAGICSTSALCISYSGNWTTADAVSDCAGRSGTYSTSTVCSTDLSMGNCAGSVSGNAVAIEHYAAGTDPTTSNATTANSACTGTYAGTFTPSSVAPKVRFMNNSGVSYSLWLDSSCGTTSGTQVANLLAHGATSTYSNITAGTYNVNYKDASTPAFCVLTTPTFSNGSSWTITGNVNPGADTVFSVP